MWTRGVCSERELQFREERTCNLCPILHVKHLFELLKLERDSAKLHNTSTKKSYKKYDKPASTVLVQHHEENLPRARARFAGLVRSGRDGAASRNTESVLGSLRRFSKYVRSFSDVPQLPDR